MQQYLILRLLISYSKFKKGGVWWCNLASSGIGSIYGAWAGGIAAGLFGALAIATGGISVAVWIIVGTTISTIACSNLKPKGIET